jgi:hypothetical protein
MEARPKFISAVMLTWPVNIYGNICLVINETNDKVLDEKLQEGSQVTPLTVYVQNENKSIFQRYYYLQQNLKLSKNERKRFPPH